jgi:hypothetical protein
MERIPETFMLSETGIATSSSAIGNPLLLIVVSRRFSGLYPPSVIF